jgi:hypothetical protein
MKHFAHAGTRNDPYAQARQARQLPILLHSMAVFRELFEIVFDSREIRTVVEVGVESGTVSGMYTELGATAVYCVDPKPTDEIRANLAKNEALHLVDGWSPEVLDEIPVADMYVLDGDHNYAIVHDEVSWIMANAPDAVIVLHDVLWPCSRRDLYYEPSSVPPQRRHPASDDGPTVWHDELSPAGFVGLGAFTSAREAGGERNGVLTAVEDALAAGEADGWQFALVPAVFGMGVMLRTTTPAAERLIERLVPYTQSRLLSIMENNRIALYTRVLEMQAQLVAGAENTDQMAETIQRQRHELEHMAGRHADEILALQQEIQRLRDMLNRRFRPRLAARIKRMGKIAEPHLRKALNK